MIQITVNIEGMHCPKCAAKIETAVADKYQVKSVHASHTEKTAVIVTELLIDDESLTSLIEALGFIVTAIRREEADKKGFFGKLFKK